MQSALEIFLTRFAFAVIPRLPRRVVVSLSRFLGYLGYVVSRKLKRIGRVNLDIAFGDTLSVERKSEILHKSFQSMALVLLDTFWYSRDTANRVTRTVFFDPAFEVLFKEKPQVLVSMHYGNWEILGMGITNKGFPLHSVAKPLKNARVDELFDEVRHTTGQQIIKRKGAVRSLLKVLQQGGKIGLVMDQNTKLSEGGQFFPFFGLPASFATAGAALAIKTRSDLIVCTMISQPDGTYRGDYCREIPVQSYLTDDDSAAATRLTADLVKDMEDVIRRQPEFWLWTYKRWKYIPEGDDPEKYPFYRRKAV